MITSMSSRDLQAADGEPDPLIDEVRRIRGEICASTGHDLDRLAEELRQIQCEYANRRGVFSGVSAEAAARVEASWGDMAGPGEDPLIDEVRAVRQRLRQRDTKE